MIFPARTHEQNILADLPKNQRDARYPLSGEQQKELTKWLAESESAFLLFETALTPPLKCCAVLLQTGRTGHQTFDLIIQPVVTVPEPSSPEGVDWVEDGRMIEISCLKPEAERVVWWLLPRIGSHLMYDFPQLQGGSRGESDQRSIRLATRGARYMQEARERAIAAALAEESGQ